MFGGVISELLGIQLGGDYESVARLWIANKRHFITNAVSSAVVWSLWKLRNELCFQGTVWTGMKMVLVRIARTLRGWLAMYKKETGEVLEGLIVSLEDLSKRPAQIAWKETLTESSLQSDPSGARSSTIARSDLALAVSGYESLSQSEAAGVSRAFALNCA